MEAKDKAKELVDNFRLNVLDHQGSGLNSFKAKQCALIAVDELLDVTKKVTHSPIVLVCDNEVHTHSETFYSRFWTEVKQEINKL